MRVEEIIEHTPPGEVDALLLELGAKNTVRVVLHKASRGPRSGYTAYRKVLDEMGATTLHRSALLELDTVRKLRGLKPRYLDELARLAEWDGLVVGVNIRTNAGIDYVADSLGNNASRPAVAQYMALSNDGTAPALSGHGAGGRDHVGRRLGVGADDRDVCALDDDHDVHAPEDVHCCGHRGGGAEGRDLHSGDRRHPVRLVAFHGDPDGGDGSADADPLDHDLGKGYRI